MIIKREFAISLTTNCSSRREGLSAQCRSSSTTTSGLASEADRRNAVMESKSLKRACSGSNCGAG